MTTHHRIRYGTIEVAREVGLSLRQLYYWVHVLHVVRPRTRRHGLRTFQHFTARDVETLSMVKRLRQQGVTLQAAVRRVRRSR